MVGTRRASRLAMVLGLLATFGSTGCVERRYTIRSDPPGALAIVNGQEIGITPVSAPFTYYGDREIILIKDGYETLRVIQPIRAPIYDNLLTEVFTENLLPFTLRDERPFTYTLSPSQIPENKDLMARAESLRAQGHVNPPPRRGGILGFFGF